MAVLANVNATKIYVTNGNSRGDGSLGQALLSSTCGDIVIVKSSEVNYIDWSDGFIGIICDITLLNPDEDFVKVDAMDSNNFFVVSGGTMIIDGFHFTNGRSDNGGAIMNSSNLELRNCKINKCEATGDDSKGGAIYSTSSSNLTVAKNTYFELNDAAKGGAVYLESGNHNFSNCTFYQNSADSTGAAISIKSSSILYIANSTFVANGSLLTGLYGGAICSFDPSLEIRSCTFNNNFATYGGAIYVPNDEPFAMFNTIVCYNIASGGGRNISGTLQQSYNNLVRIDEGLTFNSDNNSLIGTSDEPVDPMLNSYKTASQTAGIHTLEEGSPAIDAASSSALRKDQLGKYRNGIADIGAVEYNGCDEADCGGDEEENSIEKDHCIVGYQVYPNPVQDIITISNTSKYFDQGNRF